MEAPFALVRLRFAVFVTPPNTLLTAERSSLWIRFPISDLSSQCTAEIGDTWRTL
jgi:hypothetical protein